MGKYPCPFLICLSCFLCRKLQILLCCIHQLGKRGVTSCRRVWPVYWFCTLSHQGRGIGPGCDPYCPHTFPHTWPLVPCFHLTCLCRPITPGKSFLQARWRGVLPLWKKVPTAKLRPLICGPFRPSVFFDRPLFFRQITYSQYNITYKGDPNYFTKLSIQWIPSFSQNRGKINMILKLLPPL